MAIWGVLESEILLLTTKNISVFRVVLLSKLYLYTHKKGRKKRAIDM